MAVSLDIIIVNWNTGKHLLDCLLSIVVSEKSRFTLSRVVVIDNASTDGSLDGLKNLCLPLTIILNSENRGFAAACNQGAKQSRADYLLFLNPDTCLYKDTLVVPMNFMQQQENAHVGICGARLVNEDGAMAICCARFPTMKVLLGKMTGLSQVFPS